eukprot:c26547_g1_i1 orf=100-666(+)
MHLAALACSTLSPVPLKCAPLFQHCVVLSADRLPSRRLIGVRGQQWSPNLILMRQRADQENGFPGDEPPESLFMRELKRRGIPSTSLSDDGQTSSYDSTGTEIKTKEGEIEGTIKAQSRPRVKPKSDWYEQWGWSGQRERSMLLNSEGLDYFGTSFVHPGNISSGEKPSFVDPYQLLEKDDPSHAPFS